jgi:Aminoglycoside phosphotransferase
MAPLHEDLVLVHGDYCLPNILLSPIDGELQVTGLVDCGRAGIGTATKISRWRYGV